MVSPPQVCIAGNSGKSIETIRFAITAKDRHEKITISGPGYLSSVSYILKRDTKSDTSYDTCQEFYCCYTHWNNSLALTDSWGCSKAGQVFGCSDYSWNPAGIYRRFAGCGAATSSYCALLARPLQSHCPQAIPPHTGIEHGVFATRSPDRPNPIGICVVDFVCREGNQLFVRGLDALDGTPLLDIKPYSAVLDSVKQ